MQQNDLILCVMDKVWFQLKRWHTLRRRLHIEPLLLYYSPVFHSVERFSNFLLPTHDQMSFHGAANIFKANQNLVLNV